MILENFMSCLKTSMKVTLKNIDGDTLITFYSDGYTGVEGDVLARTIKRIEVTSASSISIIIADLDNEQDIEPDDTDPNINP